MNPTELEEIKKRVDEASPGPWGMYYAFGSKDLPCEIRHPNGTATVLEWNEKSDSSFADVEFIAHARTDIPALIHALEKAWAEIERLNRFGEISVFGTEACLNCPEGRVTLYSRGRICIECRNQALQSEKKEPG